MEVRKSNLVCVVVSCEVLILLALCRGSQAVDPGAGPVNKAVNKNNTTTDQKAGNSSLLNTTVAVEQSLTKDPLLENGSPVTVGPNQTEIRPNLTENVPASVDEAPPAVPAKKKVPLHTLEELESIAGPWACSSMVYCQGPILDSVQRNRLFRDSKTFVDMPMKDDPDKVVKAYQELVKEKGNLTRKDLLEFVEAHFEETGHELETWTPADWTESPALLEKIKCGDYKEWARDLNGLWKTLGRRIKDEVFQNPDRYSIIPVPHGFIIPGDRFREYYYWDTYWIINGLLLSDMVNTTRGILQNLFHVVDKYGFVPNGGRLYFTQRSQPPLLASMVDAYYQASNDQQFITDNFILMEKEYNFWIQDRTVSVEKDGKSHNLAVYSVNLTHPRPEGYVEDLELVRGLHLNVSATKFRMLASGAESGWDYSTRWFDWKETPHLRSIKAASIIPADLNTFLYYTETILAKMAAIAGHGNKTADYASRAERRLAAMEAVLWNEEDGIWYDYDLEEQEPRNRFFLSNMAPLLIYSANEEKVNKAIKYLKKEGVLDYPGGLPTSRTNSGQQWDFPNTWAPIVYLASTSLGNSNLTEGRALAQEISKTWLESAYTSWKRTGKMYEKYGVTSKGEAGGGGEYQVQVGFGWTNGYTLQLLNSYGDVLGAPDVTDYGTTSWDLHPGDQTLMFILIPIAIFIIAVLFFICVMKKHTRKRAGKATRDNTAYSASHFQKLN